MDDVEIHVVDRHQPATLSFQGTNGEPFLDYCPETGWRLNMENYHPLALQVSEFDALPEALDRARAVLAKPLSESGLVRSGRVNLLRQWGEPGSGSYFLDANLEPDGTLTIYGQSLGPRVDDDDDGEYEYWYGIKAADLPALLVALGGAADENVLAFLEHHWSGEAATRLERAIRDSGVPYRFFNSV